MKAALKAVKKPVKQARGLGKGLSALMSDSYSQTPVEANDDVVQDNEAPRQPQTLPLHVIHSGQYQPRGYFDDAALSELADSIRRNGVMQPILVRQTADGTYEIIAGERRWRAAKMAQLAEIPVLIREISDEQALEMALVENVQREGLHPLEEAAGYRRLMDEFGYTQELLSAAVQKSRSHVANLLRMLDMPRSIRLRFASNELTMGHTRALMTLSDEQAAALAEEVVQRGLNVRQTERLVRKYKRELTGILHPDERAAGDIPAAAFAQEAPAAQLSPVRENNPAPPSAAKAKDPDILALEETLSENLGLRVSIEDRGQSGEISIRYESLEQLDEVLRRLGGSA